MSHLIPVIFFPVAEAEVPTRLETWDDVAALVGRKLDTAPHSGYRQAASRNWWHLNALWRLSMALTGADLGFLMDEVSCLGPETLTRASHSIERVLLMAQGRIPNLGAYEHTDLALLRQPGAEAAVSAAVAEPLVESRDSGSGAAIAFYSFVKSLLAAIDECLSTGSRLMYIQIDYRAYHPHA